MELAWAGEGAELEAVRDVVGLLATTPMMMTGRSLVGLAMLKLEHC